MNRTNNNVRDAARRLRKPARLAAAALGLLAGQAAAIPPAWQWQWVHGAAPTDENIRCTIQTLDGGYISVGDRRGPAAGAPIDILVIRTDSDGVVVWERVIDGGQDERAYSVVEMTDGGFAIAGDTNSSAAGFETFLLKIGPGGGMLWAWTYPGNMGGPAPQSARVIQAANNDLVVASRMTGIGPAGAQHPTLFRATAAGVPVFQFAYFDGRYGQSEIGAFNDVVARPVAGAPDNLVMVGSTSPGPAGAARQMLVVQTDAAGNPTFSAAYYALALDTFANSVTIAPGNDVAFAGRLTVPGMPESTALVRTNPAFAPLFSRTYSDCFGSIGSLWALSTGSFLIGGSALQAVGAVTRDLWMARLDAFGMPLWSARYGDVLDDQGHTVGIASDGLFVAGETHSFGGGDSNGYIVKTDTTGHSECFEADFNPTVVNIPAAPTGIALGQAAVPTVAWNPVSTPIDLAVHNLCSQCPADLNGDGLVDFADYLEFLNLYDAGDAQADYNGDGLVDFSDYLEFLNFYNQCS